MYDNWEDLEKSILECKKCRLCTNRTNIVFGQGNKKARLMFIGEGPGADEDKQGIPFVGKAGQLMNNAFQALEINREDVYIANIVKCRPPSNRVPEDDEVQTCLKLFKKSSNTNKTKNYSVIRKYSIKEYIRKRVWNNCGTWKLDGEKRH